jgi:hypothetical protein
MSDSPAILKIRRRRKLGDEPGWYEVATAARQKLEDIPHGQGSARLTEIGAQYDRRPDTLRRFIAAAAFVDRIKGDDLSPVLKTLPVAGVELISRWWVYDADSARSAAIELANGSYTIEELRNAEKEARKSSKAIRWGRAGHHALRTRLSPQIKEMVQAEGEEAFVLDKPGRFDPRKLDYLYRSERDPKYRIAVLLFGPFQDEELYWTREDDFLLNILGLSKVYSKVIGIIPSYKIFAEFEAWLDHIADPNLRFYYVNPKDETIQSPRSIHHRWPR